MKNHENLHLPRDARTSLVLAGGGAAGLGEITGDLKAIQDFTGLDHKTLFGNVPILGTSAGAIGAGFAVAGVEFKHTRNVEQYSWPGCLLKPHFLENTLNDIYEEAGIDLSEVDASNVEATVLRVGSLSLRHVKPGLMKINGADVPLPILGAASSAVPGVFPAVRIGKDFFIDGGAGLSASHVPLAPPTENTIVIAPLAEHFMPPVGGLLERQLINEIDERQQKNGGIVVYLRPNRKRGHKVHNIVDVFRVGVGQELYEDAYEDTMDMLEKRVGDKGKVDLGDIAVRLSMYEEYTTPLYQSSRRAA